MKTLSLILFDELFFLKIINNVFNIFQSYMQIISAYFLSLIILYKKQNNLNKKINKSITKIFLLEKFLKFIFFFFFILHFFSVIIYDISIVICCWYMKIYYFILWHLFFLYISIRHSHNHSIHFQKLNIHF